MDGEDSLFAKTSPPRRRLLAVVDEFNKSYGVKIVFFTVGYSTFKCEQLVLL
jgi:hypothetical protein